MIFFLTGLSMEDHFTLCFNQHLALKNVSNALCDTFSYNYFIIMISLN